MSKYYQQNLNEYLTQICNPNYNTTPNDLKEGLFRMYVKMREL